MRVLIIGCGYVGMALARELAQSGHEIHAMYRTEGRSADLESAGFIPVRGDITQPETLTRLKPNYHWVVNCVSASGGGVDEYRQVYLNGMRNVVEWLNEAPPQRFIYTSSTSVYGQTDGSLVDERSAAEPVAETARTLLQTEELLLEAARQKTLNAIILRVAGIYGPGRGYWLKQFLDGQARIESGGKRWLNMVHCVDVVGAIIAALQQGKSGEVYNVVDDEPVQQLTLFEWLAATLGRPMPPAIEGATTVNRKREITNKRVTNRKLKHELGYEFKYPTFREGFTRELAMRGSS